MKLSTAEKLALLKLLRVAGDAGLRHPLRGLLTEIENEVLVGFEERAVGGAPGSSCAQCEVCEADVDETDCGLCSDCRDACPGCGCKPGDGLTASCTDAAGCGYFRSIEVAS